MSPLIFRHIVFQEKPCIPAMFLLHERKLTVAHKDNMFKECISKISSLKCLLVTDGENYESSTRGAANDFSCSMLEPHLSRHSILAS